MSTHTNTSVSFPSRVHTPLEDEKLALVPLADSVGGGSIYSPELGS